jgi:hypothetical protein
MALGMLLLLPFSAAFAAAPTLTTIPNVTLNAFTTASVNVVASDLQGRTITLTSSLPAFAHLNTPTTGTGVVTTTLGLNPSASEVGTYTGSVTATAGGEATTKTFSITVNTAGSDQAPVVLAPQYVTGEVGTNVMVYVTASDATSISSLTAVGLPSGATFTANSTNTAGTLLWTPGSNQAGEYDVVFVAANALSGSNATHLHITGGTSGGTLTLAPIGNVTVAEGSTATVTVNAAAGASDAITLTGSLPSFATLSSPTTGTGSVQTSIHLAPGAGTAGTYTATVTATSGTQTVSKTLLITVTSSGGGGGDLTLAPIGNVTLAEGGTATVDVDVSGAGSGAIQVAASLPSFATLHSPTTGTGSLHTTISLAPGAGTAGTYAASVTATSGSQTRTRNFTITVTSAGGGGGSGNAMFTLIGSFDVGSQTTCFKIKPLSNSFDLRAVLLSSITLETMGHSLGAVDASLVLKCHGGGGGGGDDGDDDGGGGDCDNNARQANLGGGHGDKHGHHGDDGDHNGDGDGDHHGDGDDNCEHGDCDDGGGGGGADSCDATSIRACFSTQDLITACGTLPGDLATATIHGNLSGGGTFTATFHASGLAKQDKGDKNKRGMNPKARPNPLNPSTRLSFTVSQPGRVRVTVYDMQGRLVSKLLDEYRAAGQQTLVWDGSNARNGKVASGVYLFRISAADGEAVQRVAVVK